MICLFCKKEMVLNPATLVSGCSKCKIYYSTFRDYYYGYVDENGFQPRLEVKNLLTVTIYINFNKLKIMDHGRGCSVIEFNIENFTLECVNKLIKKIFKMKKYI